MYRKIRSSWSKHIDFIIWDIVCLEFAFFLAYLIWQGSPMVYSSQVYASFAIVLLLVDICVLIFARTLKNVLKRDSVQELTATLRHVILVTLIAVLYMFAVKMADDFSRMTLFLTAILYGVITYFVRILWKRFIVSRIHSGQLHSALVITDMEQLGHVEHDIRHHNYEMFQVSGIVVMDLPQDGGFPKVGDDICGIRIVADGSGMTEYICRTWVDEVFVDLKVKSPELERILPQLTEMGLTVHIKLVENFELGGQKQFVEKMGKFTVLTTSMTTVTATGLFFKRLLDIIGGMLGCVCTGILFIFVAPAIYVQSPGPIFFSQTRVGKNGKRFKLYKFRSMYLDAEERKAELMKDNRVGDGLMFKLDYDPRIIGCRRLPDGTVKKGFGNWIRDCSIDEFPQFWNVLKGDMSLVGTRPPTVDEWERYDLHHRSRLAIKPGITGMWQVSGRSNIVEFEQVVELDRYYIANWSLGLDLKIILKTIPAVFGREGAL
ncbi:MAG: sugar transferase [Clostridiales bacterium]|nr:sugar transferase [Clostridiales bacterium]